MEEDLQKEISDLKSHVDHLNQKINQVQEELKEVKTDTEKTKKTASSTLSSARGNGDAIRFIALILIALLAFINNPSFGDHYESLVKQGHLPNIVESRRAFKSYYIFSTISSLPSDPEEKMITFGIFGNVFTINAP